MAHQVVYIDHCGLISEVPNVVLVVQYLAVECHGRSIVNGLGERAAHLLPDVEQLKLGEDAAAADLGFEFFECAVDEGLQVRQLGLYLVLVLTVELNHGLHARRLAIQAVAIAGLLDVQVVVEALVKLVQDLVQTGLAQDLVSGPRS